MGIFLDTNEDNAEFRGRLHDLRKNNLGRKPVNSLENKSWKCRLCGLHCDDLDALERHSIEKHSRDYCYFRVNDEIGRGDETFLIDKPVRTCSLVLHEISSKSLQIYGNDSQLSFSVDPGQNIATRLLVFVGSVIMQLKNFANQLNHRYSYLVIGATSFTLTDAGVLARSKKVPAFLSKCRHK